MMELKRVAYGVIMASTLIIVRYIDIHIYNMSTFLSILFLILIMVVSYKLVARSTFFDRHISRNSYYVMNTLIITLLLLCLCAIKS